MIWNLNVPKIWYYVHGNLNTRNLLLNHFLFKQFECTYIVYLYISEKCLVLNAPKFCESIH